MMKLLQAVVIAVAFLFGSSGHAASSVVNAVLDHPHVFPGPSDRRPTYYTQFLTPGFEFNPGDTLDITLTFPSGAPLKLTFLPSEVLFTIFGGGGFTSTIYQMTATLRFINPIGAVHSTTGPRTGVFDRNPAINFTEVRKRDDGSLSFTGLHVVARLDSALLPDGSTAPPGTFSAFQVSFVSDVPETATWAMMIGGFGMLGAAARRRRSCFQTNVGKPLKGQRFVVASHELA